jgi:hypothetical protein
MCDRIEILQPTNAPPASAHSMIAAAGRQSPANVKGPPGGGALLRRLCVSAREVGMGRRYLEIRETYPGRWSRRSRSSVERVTNGVGVNSGCEGSRGRGAW